MSWARSFRRRHSLKRSAAPRSTCPPLRRQVYLVQREMPSRRWIYRGWIDTQ